MKSNSPQPETRNGARILLTGAAGFIGSHTAEQLVMNGHQVIGLDNLSTGHLSNLNNLRGNQNFEFIEANVLDEYRFNRVMKQFQPHTIIHLAGLVSVVQAQQEPAINFSLNVQATDLIARSAVANGTRRVVFSSSAAVYGDLEEYMIHEDSPTRPIGLYGAAKLASENLLLGYARSYPLEVVCLRYFNVYGDRQDPKNPYSGVISIFSDRFSAGKPVKVFGDGEQTRDFVSVRDVARANRLAATVSKIQSGSRNICTGQSRSINDVVQIFQSIYPEAPNPDYAESRAGEILHSCGNGGYAAMMLGFEPYVSMEDGLSDLVAVQNLANYSANFVSPARRSTVPKEAAAQ